MPRIGMIVIKMGLSNSDDCDDFDPLSTSSLEDGDCDGILTGADCDDSDETDTLLSGDCDQDGVSVTDDCDDDFDASSTIVAEDADCDGVLSDSDCDDNDPISINTNINDADCDGVATNDDLMTMILPTHCMLETVIKTEPPFADDCDDYDASSTILLTDMDCDGALDIDECDGGAGISTRNRWGL